MKHIEMIVSLTEIRTIIEMKAIKSETGSFNLDTVMVNFKGIGQRRIEEIEEYSAIRIGDKIKGYGYYRSVFFPYNDHQDGRTEINKLACKLLEEKGFDCYVHYMMD